MAIVGANKKFGIKEVADVAFYEVGKVKVESNGTVTALANPLFKFDTLKVSNLEFTGETADARGGKGNAVLMSWDHSREATLTLQDALLSIDTLSALLGTANNTGNVITISANTFPGTYTVVGQTYARDEDGVDNLMTFVIYKAKVNSEATLTMEAEGDPTVLDLTLKVLRSAKDESIGAADGDMIKLIFVDGTKDTLPTMNFSSGTIITGPTAST